MFNRRLTCCFFVALLLLLTVPRDGQAQPPDPAPASAGAAGNNPGGNSAAVGATVAGAIKLPDLQHITPDSRGQVERDAVQYLRAVQASALDPDLPDSRLDRWLESVLRLPAQWEMSECGVERRNGHGPICVRITQTSRGIDLQIAIGTDERGAGRPQLVSAAIRLYDIDSYFERLAALPDILTEAEARRQRFADHPLQKLLASDVQKLRAATRANALQPELPNELFESWLRTTLASDVAAEWALVSCNPIPNAAAPQCLNIDVRWQDGARARVTLDLEMVQRGLARDPAFRMAFIYPGPPAKAVTQYRSLQEFGEALRTVSTARK